MGIKSAKVTRQASTQDTPSIAVRHDTIRIKKSSFRTAVIALFVLIAVGLAIIALSAAGIITGIEPANTASAAPSIGPANAKVVVMEFSDFYCEYCKQFHDQTFQALLDKYGNKIRFVYYDFPTSGGEQAAEAASCARDQNAYWGYHNALFSAPSAYASVDQFAWLARNLKLNESEFRACVTSGKYRDTVMQSYQLGVSYGVRATPTFLVNRVQLVGAQPLSVFEQVIDQQLAQ